MIADSLVDVVNWTIQHFIYPLFPANFPFLSYDTYNNILTNLKTDFIFTFSVINKFFPAILLLTFILVVLSAEIILFGIKLAMWFLNLIRGSGA